MRRLLRKKGVRRMIVGLIMVITLLVLFVISLNIVVWLRTRTHIVDVEQAADWEGEFDCILVLGAGVKANGEPSHMLEDRLKVGVRLYEIGASPRLLMSGDHMRVDYDEVGAMKHYAVEAGVPSNVIFLDHAGLSTYESMWRAKEIFGAKKILIVTQGYHLYRAIYIAEALGMEAHGVAADLRPYRKIVLYKTREAAARVKDFFYVRSKPQPTYLGEAVDLSGDGDSTNVNKFLPDANSQKQRT